MRLGFPIQNKVEIDLLSPVERSDRHIAFK